MLLAAATAVSMLFLLLVFVSGFTIWTHDSNLAGLTIQAAIILSPVVLLFGLKASEENLARTVALFVLSWAFAVSLTLFLTL